MMAKRKRASGGGRKRLGQSLAQNLTIRIDDDLRGHLEETTVTRAKRKRGWNLSQEILLRLRWSLNKEREDQRNTAIRSLCYLISEMGRHEFSTDAPDKQSWHRDPFAFRAFTLAVTRLLEGLQPPGEIRPPLYGVYKTPEELAGLAADHMLYTLFRTRPLTPDERAALEDLPQTEFQQFVIKHFPEIQRENYAMASVRHNLGLERKELESPARAAFRRHLGLDERKEPKS